jgi:hypothetical protein
MNEITCPICAEVIRQISDLHADIHAEILHGCPDARGSTLLKLTQADSAQWIQLDVRVALPDALPAPAAGREGE